MIRSGFWDVEHSPVHPLLAAARRLRPVLAAAAPDIDTGGRIPEDIIERLRREGFFRLAVPREYGGDEVDPLVVFEALEELALGDASTAWVVLIICANPLLFARALHPSAWRMLYRGGPDTASAGSIAPTGRAIPVAGGYRVTGRWKYGSGSAYSEYLLCGAMRWGEQGPVLDAAGHPQPLWFVHPRADCRLLTDTWNTTGLRGSGSYDYEIDDAFVSEACTLELGADRYPLANPIYRFPTLPFSQLAGITLALARRAIDTVRALAPVKRRGPLLLCEDPTLQIRLAEAEAACGAARAYVMTVVRDLLDALARGEEPGFERRARFRLAATYAVDQSVSVVDAMYKIAGGDAISAGSVLDRVFRDVHVAQTHIQMNDLSYLKAGRMLLGLPVDDPLF